MTEPILKVTALAVELAGAEALSDVSLIVPRGSCLGIVGETGSGKTIACRTLLGLERRIGARIVRGRIELDGRDVTGLSEAEWRQIRGRKVALVPQASLSGMDPLMRVGRQLEEAIRALDPGEPSRDRALALLEQVHMARPREVLRCFPHQLSGGMRQRAMIALALAGRPSLLIADEPTTALDVTVQSRILRLLASIREESGMSIVFVSHDLGVVKSVSDSVVVMYAGRTVEEGRVSSVFSDAAHPYTRALIGAQPANAPPGVPLIAIAGAPPELGKNPPGCAFQPRCPAAVDRCRTTQPEPVLVGPSHHAACLLAGKDPP